MCKKAGRKLNVLGRLSNTLDTNSKGTIFYSFILSHFNYCPLVWYFCSIEDMKKMEKIQERALRFIYNDFKSTYTELRCIAERPLLYVQRQRNLMVEVYKIINKLGPLYLHNMFTVKESNYNFRNMLALEQPKYNTVKYGFNSVIYQGAKLWNMLGNEVKQVDTLKEFKWLIKSWEGPNCNCSACTFCSLKCM